MLRALALCLAAALFAAAPAAGPARADAAADLSRKAAAALTGLYDADEGARALGARAVAVLVFPDIVKAGLVVGGAYGEGALIRKGRPDAYYQSISASFGLQAGAQSFGYAMFFMDQEGLDYLERTDGWEIGTGPSVVLIDKGAGVNVTTTTVGREIYAVVFDQTGLMAGIDIEGSKIGRFEP